MCNPEIRISDTNAQFTMNLENDKQVNYSIIFTLPIPDENHILHMENGKLRICNIAKPTPLYNPWDKSIADYYMIDECDILACCIRDSINRTLEDHYLFGYLIEPDRVQYELMRIIKTHKSIQYVTPVDKLYPNKIFIDTPNIGRNSQMPIFDASNILDYMTQSQGKNVGISMYQCKDVEIDNNGMFIKRGKQYSQILHENLLFPEYSRRRMTASNINGVVEVVDGEDPWCHHPEYDHKRRRDEFQITGTLSGKHLKTILCPFLTYKEQIAISKTASEMLTVKQLNEQTFLVPKSISNFKMMVKIGDIVEKGKVLAKHEKIKRLGCHSSKYICKIDKGVIRDLKITTYLFQGKKYNRVYLLYETIHTLETGDKITNRAGGKGVVFVLPDDQFPKNVHCATSPLAVLKRRNLGMLVEMMANEKAEDIQDFHMHYDHFEPTSHFHNLYNEGYGKTKEVDWNGKATDLYVAPLYWMVLDKYSSKAIKCNTEHCHFDNTGNPTNKGKLSGTKISPSEMALITTAKGWSDELLHKHLIANKDDKPSEYVRNLLVALRS